MCFYYLPAFATAFAARPWRTPFAELSHGFRAWRFGFRGVPHMNPNTKSRHGGFWCCSIERIQHVQHDILICMSICQQTWGILASMGVLSCVIPKGAQIGWFRPAFLFNRFQELLKEVACADSIHYSTQHDPSNLHLHSTSHNMIITYHRFITTLPWHLHHLHHSIRVEHGTSASSLPQPPNIALPKSASRVRELDGTRVITVTTLPKKHHKKSACGLLQYLQ